MKVAIIGGSGKMGRWLASFMAGEGLDVVIAGRDRARLLEAGRQLGVGTATSNVEAVRGADVLVLSVPLDSLDEVLKQIGPHLHEKQAVVDISSVKVRPVSAMHQHLPGRITLGVHPLFGPGARGVAGHNFVLTPTSDGESALADKVRRYLETRLARVTLMSPEEHDRMMAVVLGLAHFIVLVSADTLVDVGGLEKMEAVSGITYRALSTLVESVVAEDPELYASLQMSLPGMVELEGRFGENVRKWGDMVKNRDKKGFVERMRSLKAAFEKANPDFGRAYQNMYRLTERE